MSGVCNKRYVRFRAYVLKSMKSKEDFIDGDTSMGAGNETAGSDITGV